VEARELIERHFPGSSFSTWWGRAVDLVKLERERIHRIADVLALPPHELDELALIKLELALIKLDLERVDHR
jgi:hypothetical protein